MADYIETLFLILVAAVILLQASSFIINSLEMSPGSTPSRVLRTIRRIISGLAGVPAIALTIFFSRGIVTGGFNLMTIAWTACPAMAAVLLFWFAVRGNSEREVKIIQSGWEWGVIIGGISFVLGFIIVPMIVSFITGRDQAQGPLLGIFVTGPLGFPLGVIIGVLVKLWRPTRQ